MPKTITFQFELYLKTCSYSPVDLGLIAGIGLTVKGHVTGEILPPPYLAIDARR